MQVWEEREPRKGARTLGVVGIEPLAQERTATDGRGPATNPGDPCDGTDVHRFFAHGEVLAASTLQHLKATTCVNGDGVAMQPWEHYDRHCDVWSDSVLHRMVHAG